MKNIMRPVREKLVPGCPDARAKPLSSAFTDRCAISVLTLAMSLACGRAHAQPSASDSETPSSQAQVTRIDVGKPGASDLQTLSSPAFASSESSSSPGAAQPIPLSTSGTPAPEGLPNAAVPPSLTTLSSSVPQDPYANYEWKSVLVNLPPPLTDTVDGNLFGYRQKLADEYGIGYYGLDVNSFYDNILRHDHSGPQSYFGQKPTIFVQSFFYLTFDLSRYGIPDGQIVAGTSYFASSWNAIAPTEINLGQLSYYQTLFNKHLEVKVGLLTSLFEYLGEFTGGSLEGGAFGPTGDQLLNTGGSGLGFPTYGIALTAHPTKNIYDKLGLARGVTPLGFIEEHNFNPVGTRFSTPRTGAWVINELGYLRPAKPGVPEMWVRGGGVFTGSQYTELDHPDLTNHSNYFLYLFGDRQLSQISSKPGEAYRGMYAGFTMEYSPPNLNTFSEYYEARVYGLGILPRRPFDEVSFVATDTFFSSFQFSQLRALNQLAHADSKAITGSYSFHLLPGVYVSAGLQYVNHPTPLTYTGTTGSALNTLTALDLFF